MNEKNGNELVVTAPTALEAISRAEVDIQIATAHRYPREISKCLDNMKALATLTPETAQEMTYVVPRGGKNISGPSVRLAEIAASSWNNMHAGSRVIEIGDTFVVAQGVAHDLEKNYRYQHEVRRRITDRNGKRFSDDMIVITANAACAIAFREAIFHTVPRSLVNSVWDAAQQVAIGQDTGFEKRRNDAFAWFSQQGADQKRVLAALGRNDVGQVTPADVQTLHGIYQAIQTGEASIAEAMPEEKTFQAPTTNGNEPPEPTPEPKRQTVRRRRTRPTLIHGKNVKTHGVSGETAEAVEQALLNHPQGATIAKAFCDELSLSQNHVTFLSEPEALALLSRLAVSDPPADELPPAWDGPPAQEAEEVPDRQNGTPGDTSEPPTTKPAANEQTSPPAQGTAHGTTESFGPETTTDKPVSVENWFGPAPDPVEDEHTMVGRFPMAFALPIEGGGTRVLFNCPKLEGKPVFPYMCHHCAFYYDDDGNPCPAWEHV